jgi:hypothetical protein
MSVTNFDDSDDDYLQWLVNNPSSYVINVLRNQRGPAMVHTAACHTIKSRPPFVTGDYMKICATALGDVDQWASDHAGAVMKRCGVCQPPGYTARSQPSAPVNPVSPAPASAAAEPDTTATHDWEIDADDGQRRVRLWSNSYIPFERLTDDQWAAREALRRAVRSLAAGPDEILHASYAGPKPANMDVENLVLYNIDGTASGCFQDGVRHGTRFEIAGELHGNPPSGRRFARSYQYGLTTPDSDLSHWRRGRPLASLAEADLGGFKSAKRLEQVWFAIHQAEVEPIGQRISPTERFAVFLTLSHPDTKSVGANAELVKALIDGAVAAFQVHDDIESVDEIAARLARILGKPADLIKQMLLDAMRAVLGPDRLVYLRGAGVQWNPADHLCVAGQVLCRPVAGTAWTLSGEIHAVEQLRPAGSRS